MTSEKSLRLNLTADGIFHTVQGEGRFVGVPSIFVRLSGCNLRCAWKDEDGKVTLCDTPYSSHQPERNIRPVKEVLQDVMDINCKHVVITGGEPFMQKPVVALIDTLVYNKRHVTVETNGTLFLECAASFLSISPKLKSSCFPESPGYASHDAKRLDPGVLTRMVQHDHQLKFVVNSPEDLAEIDEYVAGLSARVKKDLRESVYLMPQGISVEQFDAKLPWMIEWAKARGFNIADRFHIRVFGAKRGV